MVVNSFCQESERRLATVMFADISGFTAMSEKMDPEEVTILMNSCFLMMEKIIEKFGGTIDKFIGDCVMVLFGAPAAIENSAQKAIQTALEIQKGLHLFNVEKDLEIPLNIHVGINTGTVVAGNVGGNRKREYTVMGDTVNIASRLEGISRVGQILVGPDTYRAVKGQFQFNKLKPVALKGKSEILPVYELLPPKNVSYKKEPGKRQMIFSDLVGRDTEIALIEFGFRKLIAGKGGVTTLVGEAGIGKSRLLAEAMKSGVCCQLHIIEGRSISIGSNLGFHSFNSLLQNWAGIKENDHEGIAFRKLEEVIQPLFGDESEEILPFIAILSGLVLPDRFAKRIKDIEGEALEILILKSVKSLLAKLVSIKPVVVVMEDFHWADKSSGEFFTALTALCIEYPILFMVLLRPAYDERIKKLIGSMRINYPDQYTEIVVQPLTDSQSEKLIHNLLNSSGIPAKVRDQILMRADGNPFFIEEVMRSFIDMGVVVMKNGCYESTTMIDAVTIPQNVNDVVMSRIDRLEDNARELVRVASVIGRSFFRRILSVVADCDDNIDSSLMKLKEIQLIQERHRMEETEFVFKHALAQETAYASILLQRRRELHRKTATAIETVFKERINEFYGMLSYHYISSDDMDKAEEFLLKAGEEALRSGASNEALYYYQEALSIYLNKYGDEADPMKMAMIEKHIALSFYNRGQYKEALEFFTKALTHYNIEIPEKRYLVFPCFAVTFVDFLVSLYFPRVKWRKNPEQHDIDVIGLFYYKVATLLYIDAKRFFFESFFFSRYLSKFDIQKIKGGIGMFVGLSVAFSWSAVSFRLSEKILSFVKTKIVPEDKRSRLNVELASLFLGYYTGKWEVIYDSSLVDFGLKKGEIMHVSGYIAFCGRIQAEQGRYQEARKMVRQLAEIGNAYSHDFTRTLKYFLNTKLLMKYRKLQAALIEAEEGIDFISRTDFKQVLMVLHSFKAMIYLLLEDIRNAKKSLRTADKIRLETDIVAPYLCHYQMSVVHFQVHKLKIIIEQGNQAQLAECRKDAFSACKTMIKSSKKVASYRTEAYRLMGNYYHLIGCHRHAVKWWNKSISSGDRLGARLEVARTCFAVGKHQHSKNKNRMNKGKMNGNFYLERAERLFLVMDLHWDLARVQDIIALKDC